RAARLVARQTARGPPAHSGRRLAVTPGRGQPAPAPALERLERGRRSIGIHLERRQLAMGPAPFAPEAGAPLLVENARRESLRRARRPGQVATRGGAVA